ncbi:MAG: hypothetical protein AABX44_00295 [Nanoarchaeota archaeon]
MKKRVILVILFLVFIGCNATIKIDKEFSLKTPIFITKAADGENGENAKLAELFKSSFSKELLKKGYIVADAPDNQNIVARFRIRKRRVTPLNNMVQVWIEFDHHNKRITQYGANALTSILFDAEWAIKTRLAPAHADMLSIFFKKAGD